ncbi:cytochrome P450 [Clathrospora elynae]|uniref:Cytochrome P450 n=1 Tax=Clathrospora elynae TaxID=706981 RepID=A0A6A5S7M8_9PLEO|nr:cytochrome P450 [Clathrospora elynae]
MHTLLAVGVAIILFAYFILQALLHSTQNKREPRLLEFTVPFLDSAIGIMRHGASYLQNLRNKHQVSIHTLRMPFQRLYIVHAPHLIQIIQSKANAATFVPNLLDFGILFSGLNKDAQISLRKAVSVQGNGFTISVHKYLLSGPSLNTATKAAIDRLSESLPKSFTDNHQEGLLELVRHELALALTGAIYGPENPFNDPEIEASWMGFLPGISHLLYSPFPYLTARKALRSRSRVIDAFKKYFRTGGHLQAFPMISEMYEINKGHGIAPDESAKLELATSLAMLSSGGITTFWLLFHILSDAGTMRSIRDELYAVAKDESKNGDITRRTKVLILNGIKESCPTLLAMLNETLRYHSTVINIKEVQHDTTLAEQYFLKKEAIVMIPGQSVHHNTDIWGPSANTFDHHRFISAEFKKNLASTSAFRPFGAGVTMCPGRHFSTNVILSLVAMIVVQYDVLPQEGQWVTPTKRNADLWNAMPKPDWDINVRLVKRVAEKEVEWKFVWSEGATVV